MFNIYNKRYIQYGFLQGDGNLGRLKSTTHKGLEVNIGKFDDDILPLFGLKREFEGQRSFYVNGFNNDLINLKFSRNSLPDRRLPKTIDEWKEDDLISFIRGLYSANGSVIATKRKVKNGYRKTCRIAFKSTCLDLILKLKEIMDNRGYKTYYTTNKSKKIKFNNGEFLCKESYDLNIGRKENVEKFLNKIGFEQEYKNIKGYELLKGEIINDM